MLKNKLFTKRQFGFIKGRSSTLQLLKVMDEWTKALEEGKTIDCVYMDFMKAFDVVPHHRLLSKLTSYGFSELMINWIKEFITGRSQRVRIDGILSEKEIVKSGIPQGTVLGPFLFLIFINDLPDSIISQLYLFADDCKVYKVLKNASKDREALQEDLDRLYKWSELWLMKIHPDKLVNMEIGIHREYPDYEYTIGPMVAKNTRLEKDIGILVDDNLKFSEHIDSIVKKANGKAGWLRRSFQFMSPKMFKPLYMQVVRSQMEYGSSIWNPHFITLIDKIEMVQDRATKMLPTMRDKTYEERLKIMNLPTLRYRRARGDMINVYNILNCEDKDLCPDMKMLVDVTGRDGRNNSLSLYKSFNQLDVRKYSFTERVTDLWNSLPNDVVTAPSINCFKSRIDKFWRHEPVKFDHKEDFRCIRRR